MKIVVKRDGQEVIYNDKKIIKAIERANLEVLPKQRITKKSILIILDKLSKINKEKITVEEIQDFIESKLVEINKYALVKKYIIYRYTRTLIRKKNTTDDSVLSIIQNTNKEIQEENSNKNANMACTQRDLIAGEVSKDLAQRVLLPEKLSKAHNDGVLHFHDMDYFLQPIFNCCLINIKDMLDNGTVINGKMIESPKSFQVACTILTQIISAVACSQYGGQSVDIRHLGKYLRISYNKYYKRTFDKYKDVMDKNLIDDIVNDRLIEELRSGIQTIQYQINTLMTTNGQSPFVTLFLHLDDNDPYKKETALIIEEILKQRYQGIKNQQNVYITPAFPKLVYVLEENNILKGGQYDYLTRLAIKCSSKRMYPDYISGKKMREYYQGNVFSPMGCRSFLSPYKNKKGDYLFEGRFNQGVVSLNLPQIGILSGSDQDTYMKLLDKRLKLVKEALMQRHYRLLGTPSTVSPIHWMHGAIARLPKDEKIDDFLKEGYSTLSLGYIGLYEATKLVTGVSHTSEKGKKFALKVMNKLSEACIKWKEETGLGFGLYGTPAESLCYRFAKIDKQKFGEIPDITDKGYYTNSYHVDVRENIFALDKLKFESEFQKISNGGAISYVEIPNLSKNLEALEEIIKFIYDNIQYAEFNTKSDYCHLCGFDQEIIVNKQGNWECPQCKNQDHSKMNVTRRTCGYLGENFWNEGKTKEISKRVLHL